MCTNVDLVKIFFMASLAACGGAGAQPSRPTPEGPASRELCILAVVNYDRVETLVLGGPAAGNVSERRALDRQRRVDDCVSRMTAREASCLSDAQKLADAQACAPSMTW